MPGLALLLVLRLTFAADPEMPLTQFHFKRVWRHAGNIEGDFVLGVCFRNVQPGRPAGQWS